MGATMAGKPSVEALVELYEACRVHEAATSGTLSFTGRLISAALSRCSREASGTVGEREVASNRWECCGRHIGCCLVCHKCHLHCECQDHRHADDPERFAVPTVGTLLKCLVCALDKPYGVFSTRSGESVCVECRDRVRANPEREAVAWGCQECRWFHWVSAMSKGAPISVMQQVHDEDKRNRACRATVRALGVIE